MQYVDPSLPRELFGWRSPRLGLDMPIARYGKAGRPLLLFPTAAADFLENERFFLIKSIEPLIFEGKVQVFCIESINKHAWMNPRLPVPEKVRRQALYSGYVEEEVVPHVRRCVGRGANGDEARIAVSGASFGAFHAANVFFRRPDVFDALIAMSGFYDLAPDYLDGFSNDDAYFNNPMWFVRGFDDARVAELRENNRIQLITGQGRWEAPWASDRFSALLHDKRIPHELAKWGFDVDHDWPWWRRMLPHYLSNLVG